ncbi:unnamed protein product, partial [Meganyctiphanes norvegica]
MDNTVQCLEQWLLEHFVEEPGCYVSSKELFNMTLESPDECLEYFDSQMYMEEILKNVSLFTIRGGHVKIKGVDVLHWIGFNVREDSPMYDDWKYQFSNYYKKDNSTAMQIAKYMGENLMKNIEDKTDTSEDEELMEMEDQQIIKRIKKKDVSVDHSRKYASVKNMEKWIKRHFEELEG